MTEPNELIHLISITPEKLDDAYTMGLPVDAICGRSFVPVEHPEDRDACADCLTLAKDAAEKASRLLHVERAITKALRVEVAKRL